MGSTLEASAFSWAFVFRARYSTSRSSRNDCSADGNDLMEDLSCDLLGTLSVNMRRKRSKGALLSALEKDDD